MIKLVFCKSFVEGIEYIQEYIKLNPNNKGELDLYKIDGIRLMELKFINTKWIFIELKSTQKSLIFRVIDNIINNSDYTFYHSSKINKNIIDIISEITNLYNKKSYKLISIS